MFAVSSQEASLEATGQEFRAVRCGTDQCGFRLSLVRTSRALNSFRISNIQEQELGNAEQDVTMLHVRPKPRLEFLRTTTVPCVFSPRRLGRFAYFELFGTIIDAMAVVKEVLN